MKRFLIAFALLGFVTFSAQAQSCCSKGKSASADKSEASCSTTEATKAASLDDSIEQRTDANTGKVSFVRRSVNAATGEASFEAVEYCSESKRFINKSPEKADCHADGKASATSGKSKSKKDCCEGGDKGGAGCAKDSKSKASSTSVKLSKTSSN